MDAIKRECNLFLLALGFLSRLPIPWALDYNANTLNASSRYFGVVGACIGLCMVSVFSLAHLVFSHELSVLLMLVANLLLTGCFHQDGLADMADGFGGAFEPARKLTIMKDSRLGTYGSSALIATLAANYLALVEIESVLVAVVIGQSVSRCVAASIIYDTPYAADPDASKAKPLAQSMSRTDVFVLMVSGALTLLLLPASSALIVVAVLLLGRNLFKRFISAQIGGYTGDCLGAAQQLSELLVYFTLLALLGTGF